MSKHPLIIIGSGLAGYTLAKEYRRLNKETEIIIISQDDGVYYSKPMLSTGFAKQKSAADLAMKSAHQMSEELSISVLAFHTVTNINADDKLITLHNHQQAVSTLAYSDLVFATGAAAIHLPFADDVKHKVFTINDLMDYATFTNALSDVKDIAIIGSGLVGTEYATDLTSAGYNVSVISLDQAPLQQLLPTQLGNAVKAQLNDDGVSWFLENKVVNSQLNNDKITLSLNNGDSIECDIVLSAVGLKPRVSIAEKAGIDVNRGIKTNKQLQTNQPNIYALGDCAEIEGNVLMYVAPITQSAKILAKVLNGENTQLSLPAMPVIVKTPTCPVVSNPPPADCKGQWKFEGEGNNQKALFTDEHQQLRGFSLTGACVIDRIKLAKQLPALL